MMMCAFQVDVKFLKEADEVLGTAFAIQYAEDHPQKEPAGDSAMAQKDDEV